MSSPGAAAALNGSEITAGPSGAGGPGSGRAPGPGRRSLNWTRKVRRRRYYVASCMVTSNRDSPESDSDPEGLVQVKTRTRNPSLRRVVFIIGITLQTTGRNRMQKLHVFFMALRCIDGFLRNLPYY